MLELLCKLPREQLHLSFYRFRPFKNLSYLQRNLFEGWSQLSVTGRIYLSEEGVNAQLSVPKVNWNTFVSFSDSINGLENISSQFNLSLHNNKSGFSALHIKIRKEIVSADFDFNKEIPKNESKYLSAREWNETIQNNDVTIVDVRNM